MSSSISVDYLSFSVDLVNRIDESMLALRVTGDALRDLIGNSIFEGIFLEPDGWQPASGRRPYRYGQANTQIGVFVWFGGHSNALIQFSGQGCKFLEQNGWLNHVMSAVQPRVTRFDVAIDILTATRPQQFVKAGYNNRIKSYGEQTSTYGDTCYIGSRKSQKFCRVYRYNFPNPRHKMLRVEYETKKEQAQIAVASTLANGLAYASESLTKYYAWEHTDMPEPGEMVEKMQSQVADRTSAKTISWLLKQCAPAFKKLVENGSIENPVEFLEKHFLNLESETNNE